MQKELLEPTAPTQTSTEAHSNQSTPPEVPSLPSLAPGWILLIATILSLLYFATNFSQQRNSQPVPQDAFPNAASMLPMPIP